MVKSQYPFKMEKVLRKDSLTESKVKRIIKNIIEFSKSSASGIITAIFMKILGI
jgi:hypothetical protein